MVLALAVGVGGLAFVIGSGFVAGKQDKVAPTISAGLSGGGNGYLNTGADVAIAEAIEVGVWFTWVSTDWEEPAAASGTRRRIRCP